MVKALVIGAIAWPVLLGAVLWGRIEGVHPIATSVVYVVASKVCHQLPDRSFHTAGVKWPVCGRCSGLYLSAPFGALLAAGTLRRRRRLSAGRLRWWLAAAAVPTALTLAAEWSGVWEPGNAVRAVAALPLGAMIAFALVRTADGTPRAIE